MAEYKKEFLKGLAHRQRAHFLEMIRRGSAYLEWANDGAQYLIIIDPAHLDESIFARLPEGNGITCIGNRVR